MAPPTDPFEPPRANPNLSAIAIPLLVSGIFNVLVGAGWAATCFGGVIAVPLWVLAVFEFILFSKVNAPGPQSQRAGQIKTIAILEICTILTGNIPSMICGIVILANIDQLRPPPDERF